jgi:O-antigen ligase
MTALAVVLSAGIALLFVRETWAWRLEQASLFLLAGWGLATGRLRIARAIPLAALALAALWGVAQVAAGRTGYGWATGDAALRWLAWAAAFAMAAWWWEEWGVEWVAALGAAVAFVAVLQRYTSEEGKIYWLFESGYRMGLMGPFVYENQYAAFIELTLPAALVLAFGEGRRHVWWAAAGAMMIASVVAAGSRAGFALVMVEAAVALALLKAGRRAGLLAGLVGLFVVIVGWQVLADKLLRERRYEDRWMLTQSTARMIGERPGMGFGLGTWAREHPAYATFDDGLFDNHAHNDWAEWAAEGGIPFALLVAAFGASMARAAWRTVWGLGLVTVLAHCWVDYHFQERAAFGALYFAVAGGVWRSWQERQGREAI